MISDMKRLTCNYGMASPVFDANGKKCGIIILYIAGSELLRELDPSSLRSFE